MIPESNINVITIDTEAFFALVDVITEQVKKNLVEEKIWIGEVEAKELLNLKSSTTMQKLRDTGTIRFTQPMKKLILYDRRSLLQFLEKYANKKLAL